MEVGDAPRGLASERALPLMTRMPTAHPGGLKLFHDFYGTVYADWTMMCIHIVVGLAPHSLIFLFKLPSFLFWAELFAIAGRIHLYVKQRFSADHSELRYLMLLIDGPRRVLPVRVAIPISCSTACHFVQAAANGGGIGRRWRAYHNQVRAVSNRHERRLHFRQ